MKDCIEREISIGDEVSFSVGTALLTGTVVEIKDRKRYGRIYETAKIKLTTPEQKGGRYRAIRDGQGNYVRDANNMVQYEHTGWTLNLFRSVYETNRIVILKPIDKSVE